MRDHVPIFYSHDDIQKVFIVYCFCFINCKFIAVIKILREANFNSIPFLTS